MITTCRPLVHHMSLPHRVDVHKKYGVLVLRTWVSIRRQVRTFTGSVRSPTILQCKTKPCHSRLRLAGVDGWPGD